MLVLVINCLRLFAVVIYCCHGDGSDETRVFKVSRLYALLSGYYVVMWLITLLCHLVWTDQSY